MPEDESVDLSNSQSVSGEGNLVAGRDINITTGVDPEIHAGFISENDRMKRAFARLGLDPDTDDFEAAIDRALENATAEEESGRSIDPEDSLSYGFAALHRGRNTRAEGYFRHALDMFEQNGNLFGQGNALGCLGTLAQRRGEYDEARELIGESLRIGNELGNKPLISSGLGELGMCEYLSGNFVDAERLIKESIEVKREAPTEFDQSAFASSLNNLGLIYSATSRLSQAEEAYSLSLDFKTEPSNIVSTIMNIAGIRLRRGDSMEAAQLYLQGLEISKKEGLRYAEGGAIKSIGDVFFELGDFKRAREHYVESLEIMEETGNRLDEARTRINLANTLISLGNLSESERELAISEKIYRELKSTVDIDELNIAWSSLHFHRGEFLEAKERLKSILSESDGTSLTSANCKYNLAIIELKFDHVESERLLREALRLYGELGMSKPNKIVAMGFGDPSEKWDYPPDNWEQFLYGKT